jgi:hypothetical protein
MYIPPISGRDSAVGIETHSWLDGVEDQIPVRARFPVSVQTGLEPNQSPIQWILGLFPGGKVAGA